MSSLIFKIPIQVTKSKWQGLDTNRRCPLLKDVHTTQKSKAKSEWLSMFKLLVTLQPSNVVSLLMTYLIIQDTSGFIASCMIKTTSGEI